MRLLNSELAMGGYSMNCTSTEALRNQKATRTAHRAASGEQGLA